MNSWRLLADIGGTNIRLARAGADRNVYDVVSKPLTETTSLADELADYAGRFEQADIADIAIAAAGPVAGRTIKLTNRDLIVDARELSGLFNGIPVELYNDLQAVALALPWLPETCVKIIYAGEGPATGPRLAVNIGTGFGAALLVPVGTGWHAIGCEPGHMTLIRDIRLACREQRQSLSVEDVLSGLTIHNSEASMRLWSRAPMAAMSDTFGPNDNPHFVDAFSALLGEVCGNLVLACGAWGGVYLFGSVASQWCAYAGINSFMESFCSKGPMRGAMARVRINAITEPNPALIGLARQ